MSYHEVQLVGATAVAIGAAALLMYSKRHTTEVVEPPPTSVLTGEVVAKILPESAEEYNRDFHRFHSAHAIFLNEKGRVFEFKKDGISELANRIEAKCNLHRLMYSLSTSIGVDVLTKLRIPPIMSQPIFLINTATGRVVLFAYIGSTPKGLRPDMKYTDWVIKISLRSNQDIIDYDIEPSNGEKSMLKIVYHK